METKNKEIKEDVKFYVAQNLNFIYKECNKAKKNLDVWEINLEDFKQDVILEVLKRIEKYNSKKSSIKTFFINSVNYSIKEVLRKYQTKMVENGKAISILVKSEKGKKRKEIFWKTKPEDFSLEEFMEKWNKNEW